MSWMRTPLRPTMGPLLTAPLRAAALFASSTAALPPVSDSELASHLTSHQFNARANPQAHMSRTSPSLLLFAIIHILVGLFFLALGKRAWRWSCALAAGLACELIAWSVMVNFLPNGTFGQYTASSSALIEWAVVSCSGLMGVLVGDLAWPMGMAMLAAEGGLSLAFGIILMVDDDLRPVARWVLIGVLTGAGLVIFPMHQARFGMALACGLTGGFLIMLGVDLIVNINDGYNLGLRYLMDNNSADAADLTSYSPGVSTRAFLATGWALAIIATGLQTYFFRDPFVRTTLRTRHPPPDPEAELTDSIRPISAVHPPQLAEIPMLDSFSTEHDSIASRIQRRYHAANRSSLGSQAGTPVAMEEGAHPAREFSSPDIPPSRPASVVSTTFANGLRSRPPTFMDEPWPTRSRSREVEVEQEVGVSPAEEVTGPVSVTGDHTQDYTAGPYSPESGWRSEAVPIIATGLAARSMGQHPAAGAEEPDDYFTIGQQTRAEHDEPGLTPTLAQPSGRTPIAHEVARRQFSDGLASGRDSSLPRTDSDPSSGDISTLLKATFGQYAFSSHHSDITATGSTAFAHDASYQAPVAFADTSPLRPRPRATAGVHSPPLTAYLAPHHSPFSVPDVPTEPSEASYYGSQASSQVPTSQGAMHGHDASYATEPELERGHGRDFSFSTHEPVSDATSLASPASTSGTFTHPGQASKNPKRYSKDREVGVSEAR